MNATRICRARIHKYVFAASCAALALAYAGCQTPCRPAAAEKTELVELTEIVPDILLDIRYATPNNFTGQAVYSSPRCFLIKDAAYALKEVQADLEREGYCLKVFDGYRPLSVQKRFWAILPDPRYVADPRQGSRHNRGYAVDLTLVDRDGNPIAMPTEFDDFTERAHPDFMDLPKDAIEHRAILRNAMERHGFTHFPTEWWHFDFHGWENKPILDIPIDKL